MDRIRDEPTGCAQRNAPFAGGTVCLQRDVLVATAPGRSFGERLRDDAASVRGVDLGVHDTDLDGAVHAACDPLVLDGQLLVQGLAVLGGGGGQLAFVKDADR